MKILAIDTSCDETSVAIVENDQILANKLSSQIQSHKEWGGVVPSLARRKHEELIDLVINQALKQAKVRFEDIDVFAVTRGPGLAVALEVGIKKAKEFAKRYQKPLVAVNHMEGHIYSTLAKNSKGKPEIIYQFPLLALLISGGHTEFVLMKDHGKYEIIGETLDDAIGECFDKVGRMLDLGYPAGPVVEEIAKKGDENRYILPIPMKNSSGANMSYSGLKTAAMKLITQELSEKNKYAVKFERSYQKTKNKEQRTVENSKSQISNSNSQLRITNYELPSGELSEDTETTRDSTLDTRDSSRILYDLAASFQKAAVEQVLIKAEFALNNLLKDYEIHDLIIGGGVAQNKYLRNMFRKKFSKKLRIHYPTDKKLYTDNAGMIGIAAYFNAKRENFVEDIDALDREPGWRIDN